MIQLFDEDKYDNTRHSSKGNQLKWRSGEVWYKADSTGYEGLVEFLISNLLRKSTLDESEYVLYSLESIAYKRTVSTGW